MTATTCVSDDRPDLAEITGRQQFGRALTTLRERAGYTVRDIAKLVDIPVATAGDYFAGRSVPPVKMAGVLPAIVRVCGETDPVRIEAWRSALIRVRRAAAGRPGRGSAPYPGLTGFREDQAEWFFGRERAAREVLRGLAERRAAGVPLVVHGAPGSGKSSLLRAGVLAPLRASGGVHLLLVPGPSPCRELAEQLRAVTGAPADVVDHAVHADPRRLGGLLRALPGPLTLVVDQAEDLFTGAGDTAIRRAFLAAVSALARAGAAVVLGLRPDVRTITAVGRPAEAVRIGPMTEDELREAIRRPAERARSTVTPELADRLVRDAATAAASDGADPLPLVSHSLLMAWRHRARGPLTLADYTATGGLSGAVRYATELALGPLDRGRDTVAAAVLDTLTTRSDDGPPRIRRTVPRTEIAHRAPAAGPGEVDRILRRLVAHRLLRLGPDTVEIAHEAVLTAWLAVVSPAAPQVC